MPSIAKRSQPVYLPSTLGFSPVDDRTRLPWRFFYRLIAGIRH